MMKKKHFISCFRMIAVARGSAMIAVTTVILLVTTASVVTLAYTVGTQSAMDALSDDQNASKTVMRSGMEIAQAELYLGATSELSNKTFQSVCDALAPINGSIRDLGAGNVAYYRRYGSVAPYKSESREGKPAQSCTLIVGGSSAGTNSEILGRIWAVETTSTSLKFEGENEFLFSIQTNSPANNAALFTHVASNRDDPGDDIRLLITTRLSGSVLCEDKYKGQNRCLRWHEVNKTGVSTEGNTAGGFVSLGSSSVGQPFNLSAGFYRKNSVEVNNPTFHALPRNFAGAGILLYPLNSNSPVRHIGSNSMKATGDMSSSYSHSVDFSDGWQCGARTFQDPIPPNAPTSGDLLKVSTQNSGANLLLMSIGSISYPGANVEIGEGSNRSVSMAKLSEVIGKLPVSAKPISQVWFAYNDATPGSSYPKAGGGMPSATSQISTSEEVLNTLQGSITSTSTSNATLVVPVDLPSDSLRVGDGVIYRTTQGINLTGRIQSTPCGTRPCSKSGSYPLNILLTLPTGANTRVGSSQDIKIARPHLRLSFQSSTGNTLREGTVLERLTGSFSRSLFSASFETVSSIRMAAGSTQFPEIGDAVFGPGIPPRTVIERIDGLVLHLKFLDFEISKQGLTSSEMPANSRVVARTAVTSSANTTSRVYLSRRQTVSSGNELCAGVCALMRDSAQSEKFFKFIFFSGPRTKETSTDISCLANVDPAMLIRKSATQTSYKMYEDHWSAPQ
jgi:hypothetical protein